MNNRLTSSKQWMIITGFLLFFQPTFVIGQEFLTFEKTQEKFVSIVHSDGDRTVLKLDLRSLPGFFERAYLLELIFQDPTVVVTETTLSADFLPLAVVSGQELSEVISTLEAFRRRAIEAGDKLPAAKQEELMKKYEKFR